MSDHDTLVDGASRAILAKLDESGERERLKDYLRSELASSGWCVPRAPPPSAVC